MKETDDHLREEHEDDYSQLLPLFIYPTEEQSQALYEDMDIVIEKNSNVIERHSIYIRRKEHVKWIDDCYLLIGKARFYKDEHGIAQDIFLYVFQSFKDIPERYDGLSWLIKSYIETRSWNKAEEFLEIGEAHKNKFPKEYRGLYYAAYADYHIKKDKDYAEAIPKLEEAIKYTKDKEALRRYTFVLAQLHHQMGMLSTAMSLYKDVIKLNPSYTMRFNARISRAMAFDKSGGSISQIKKELNKMLKDKKNEEFKDQIYYALAELALKEDNENLAIKYLKKSAQTSVSNVRQKGLSYLKLADIYFEQPSYILAQSFYDSTLQFLPEEHPEYYKADSKNSSLQELVKNLKVIQLSDSLLNLAKLSKEDQRKRVDNIIKEIKAEEERQRLAEIREQERLRIQAENQGGIFGAGKWYFYNPSNMAKGRTEFENVWGDRALEDNWRRKSRSAVLAQGGNENEELIVEDENNEKYDPEAYLANIPNSMEDKLKVHGKLVEALYNVGAIFKEDFEDPTSAIEAFERVTSTYDTSQYNLPSHYQLYRIFTVEGYKEDALIQKNWVLDNHPFSEYAYLIKNPNYNKENKETKEKIEEYYEATYRLYLYKLYDDVITSCDRADSVFKKNHIQAKFDFLRLKSIGYRSSQSVFKTEIEAFIEKHNESPLKESAQKILNFMNNENKGVSSEVLFNKEFSKPHMFMISFPENTKGLNVLKNKLSNFNGRSFREKKLDFTDTQLGKKDIFLIRTFKDDKDAMRYYKTLQNNNGLMIDVERKKGKMYVISVPNFQLLFQNSEEDKYMDFFQKNYLL